MLHHGDKGPAVSDLQEQLVVLGYALPRWGCDGDLGTETLNAVTRFLADHAAGYADADPETVSDEERALIQQVYDTTGQKIPLPGRNFFDLRKESNRNDIQGRRTWQSIVGITLHQTACDFGHEKPARWDTLSAHMGANSEGDVLWVHDFEHIIWHANELNKPTVGLECEGLYPGILDANGEPQIVTPALTAGAQGAIRFICATVAAHGGKVLYLYAHRQTAKTRQADPGEELWQKVAIPMLSALNLSDGGPTFKIDNGRVIPQQWNPAYRGNVY
jgi:hypothetical protein